MLGGSRGTYEGCVDGCLVLSHIGGAVAYFLVKGYEHPDGGLIAVPYRLGGSRLEPGDPVLWRLLTPWLVERLDCMPRPVPVLRGSLPLLPVDPARVLRMRWASLPGGVRRLVEGIDAEWVGLTGSWAVNLEGAGSDVDLLVYGDEAYPSLVDMAAEGLARPCGPRPGRVEGPLASYYGVKLVELCVGGHRVTVRILRSIERLPCRRRVGLGRLRACIELVDIGESYLVPARYKALLARGDGLWGRELLIETWRTRYQELPPGTYLVEGEAWVEGNDVVVSPDIGGSLAPTPRCDAG